MTANENGTSPLAKKLKLDTASCVKEETIPPDLTSSFFPEVQDYQRTKFKTV